MDNKTKWMFGPREIVMRGWAAMIHATHWMPIPTFPEVG